MLNRILILVFFNLSLIAAYSQDTLPAWQYLKTTDSISVYYRTYTNSEVKELRLITNFNCSANKLITTLKQVHLMPKWSSTCQTTKLIKKVNDNELFFYYTADIPWPINNKDVVLHLKFHEDTISGIHTISSNNYNDLVPINLDYDRIYYMKAHWKLIPIKNNQVQVEYRISIKLSHSFPDWLIKQAISYNPIKSMNSLKEMVENK